MSQRRPGPGRLAALLVERVSGALVAASLSAVLALTLVDVIGRRVLGRSLPGALEVTELLMVALIFGALPLVSMHREHVQFESVDRLLPPHVLSVLDRLADAVMAVAYGGLALLAARKAGQLHAYGEVTNQLSLPAWPAALLMACAGAACAVLHLSRAVGARPRP